MVEEFSIDMLCILDVSSSSEYSTYRKEKEYPLKIYGSFIVFILYKITVQMYSLRAMLFSNDHLSGGQQSDGFYTFF